MRHEHTGGAAVEHREETCRISGRNPDQTGRSGSAGGQQCHVGRDPVEGGVFLVDDDEIEPEVADDLDRMGGGRLDERPEQQLAPGEPRAEGHWCGSGKGHGTLGDGSRGRDLAPNPACMSGRRRAVSRCGTVADA
jgi:hypothetical protein